MCATTFLPRKVIFLLIKIISMHENKRNESHSPEYKAPRFWHRRSAIRLYQVLFDNSLLNNIKLFYRQYKSTIFSSYSTLSCIFVYWVNIIYIQIIPHRNISVIQSKLMPFFGIINICAGNKLCQQNHFKLAENAYINASVQSKLFIVLRAQTSFNSNTKVIYLVYKWLHWDLCC